MDRATASRGARWWLLATLGAVVLYVATWVVLGIVAPGYDPLRDAISQLFDLGAPPTQRWWFTGVLAVTGLAMVPVGFVLDRVLPGTGPLGAWLTAVAGTGTVLAAVFPCSDGCPGFGATTTDTLHVLAAGVGYVALVTAPVAFAWRLRHTEEARLARWGLALGGLATVGFVVRNLGVDVLGGLQQRVFNTAADLWFVAAALVGLRRLRDAAAQRRARLAATRGGAASPTSSTSPAAVSPQRTSAADTSP